MRRVVVTGIGLTTPLGWGTEVSWKRLLSGQSGAGRISRFDPTEYACQVACEVPRVDGRGGGGPGYEGAFDPDQVMSPRDQRRIDDSSSTPSPPPTRRCAIPAGRRRPRKTRNAPG